MSCFPFHEEGIDKGHLDLANGLLKFRQWQGQNKMFLIWSFVTWVNPAWLRINLHSGKWLILCNAENITSSADFDQEMGDFLAQRQWKS